MTADSANRGQEPVTYQDLSVQLTTQHQMILLDVFHISFVLFSMEGISKETPLKLALKPPNVQTPGAVTTSARCPFQPEVLTCTMLPQFPLVLLI